MQGGKGEPFFKKVSLPPCKQTADNTRLYFKEAQPQRVADHGEGRQSHGGAGDHGREHGPAEDMQQPGGHGQAQQVVAEGPAQILADVAHHPFVSQTVVMSPSISERAEPCCCDTTTPSSLSIFVLLVVTVSALTVAIGAGTVMLPTTIAAASTIVNNFLFFIKNTPSFVYNC